MSYGFDFTDPPQEIVMEAGTRDGFFLTARRPRYLTFFTVLWVNLLIFPLAIFSAIGFFGGPFLCVFLVFAIATQAAPAVWLWAGLGATLFAFLLGGLFFYYGPALVGPNWLAWKIAGRVRDRFPELWDNELYTVQIALEPRWTQGLRAVLDDCDDIGVLFLQPDGLRFEGDSLSFSLPRRDIRSMFDGDDSPVYGLFGLGKRTGIQLRHGSFHPYYSITFSERRSTQLFQYHRYARILFARLKNWYDQGESDADVIETDERDTE